MRQHILTICREAWKSSSFDSFFYDYRRSRTLCGGSKRREVYWKLRQIWSFTSFDVVSDSQCGGSECAFVRLIMSLTFLNKTTSHLIFIEGCSLTFTCQWLCYLVEYVRCWYSQYDMYKWNLWKNKSSLMSFQHRESRPWKDKKNLHLWYWRDQEQSSCMLEWQKKKREKREKRKEKKYKEFAAPKDDNERWVY